MTLQQVRDLTRQRPFRPFRIRTDDGSGHEIRHLEMLLLLPDAAIVGVAYDPETQVSSRFTVIPYEKMTFAEVLDTAGAA